jgi:Fe-Mn family superoxide dismutase
MIDKKKLNRTHRNGGAMRTMHRRQFLALAGMTGVACLSARPGSAFAQSEAQTRVSYNPKDYSKLLGMEGFSDTLLNNHFALYQGYVTHTNRFIETLDAMLKERKTGSPEYAEMKRRFGWEFNGMRLHEYYFENLRGQGALDKTGKLFRKLSEDFGSYETWEKDFKTTGTMRGIGWAILYHDPLNGRLMNFWINEHDIGHPAGCTPLLILDVFEHAFMIDYGLRRADYIEAFSKNIDWKVVEKRMS